MNFLPTLSNITRRRLAYATLTIVMMIAAGAIGFYLIEGSSWIDSVYIATQTVTTVGYSNIPPRTSAGKLFAVIFMLLGVGTVLYALTVLAQAVLQSEIVEVLGLRQRIREMKKLENHYIVCGAGRIGRRIIRNLQKQNLPFVIIEQDEKKVTEFAEDGANILIAGATLEENLTQTGEKRVRRLSSCLADAADTRVSARLIC